MPYQPILGTLGYILSPDKKKVLLIHRNSRPEEFSSLHAHGLVYL